MQTHRLVPHPDHPPSEVENISVLFGKVPDGRLMLRWKVNGDGDLLLPSFAGRGKGADLWKTTCFELFLMNADGSYREFNFSPSGRWAAYRFGSYRDGQEDYEPLDWPEIEVQQGSGVTVATVFLNGKELEGAEKAGVSVVVEEESGGCSYWALAHAEGGEPDFHAVENFMIAVDGGAK